MNSAEGKSQGIDDKASNDPGNANQEAENRTDHGLERRLREVELSSKELELSLKELRHELSEGKSILFSNPIAVALIGGVLTLLVSVLSGALQGYASASLEQQKHESELIHKVLDTDDAAAFQDRLKFLTEAGLISDSSGKLKAYLVRVEKGEAKIPSLAAQSGERDKSIRYFVTGLELGGLTLTRAQALLINAITSWEMETNVDFKPADSEREANVIIDSAELSGGAMTNGDVGPPTIGRKLRITFNRTQAWDDTKFQTTACYAFGKILGLTKSERSDQLMSGILDPNITKPQKEDIERVLEIWGPVQASPKPSGHHRD